MSAIAAETVPHNVVADTENGKGKILLTASAGSWTTALVFLLSMSAFGLRFYPALLVVLVVMARTYMRDRYAFLIQTTLLLGGYALTDSTVTGIGFGQVAFFISFFLMLIVRKNPVIKKLTCVWAVYFVVLLAFAFTSEESMRIQLRPLLYYSSFIYIYVPLAVLSGRKFSYDSFVRAVWPYAFILAVFYILDAFVLCGWVLIPRSHSWGADSSFFDPECYPLSGWFVRKYPPGMYLLALLVFPLARHYRIRLWQWAVIILAVLSTQTFTYISGIALAYLIMQSGLKRVLLYGLLGVVGGIGLYFIDGTMEYTDPNELEKRTPMRIKSSVDQILELTEAVDDEDIAEFGSGRLAQAIPKLELLYQLDMQWRGFGFLDKYETDNPKFIIENEYYKDQSEAIEVATDIEIVLLQILVTIGYIGLIAHILFYAYTYWAVRKLKYAGFYLSVLLIFVWLGMAGFEGLIYFMGVQMAALAISVPLLQYRSDLTYNDDKDKPCKPTTDA